MDFVCNFPAISILLCLFAGIISSGVKAKVARAINTVLVIAVIILSLFTFLYTVQTGEAFVYVMGRFPAPWGNEIRAGMLEGLMATFFGIIMLLSLLGGERKLDDVVYRIDVVGSDVALLKLGTIERHVMIDIVHDLVQALPLKLPALVAWHAFFILVPDHKATCIPGRNI